MFTYLLIYFKGVHFSGINVLVFFFFLPELNFFFPNSKLSGALQLKSASECWRNLVHYKEQMHNEISELYHVCHKNGKEKKKLGVLMNVEPVTFSTAVGRSNHCAKGRLVASEVI